MTTGDTYTIYVCNNERCATRGCEDNTFDVIELKDITLKECYLKALMIINNCENVKELINDVDDEIVNYTNEEFEYALESQDLGFGDPIVYGIKKNNRFIFKNSYSYFEKLRKEEDF